MMRIPAAALAFALLSTPAFAVADPRLQSVHYEADKVVKVHGRLGYQSMTFNQFDDMMAGCRKIAAAMELRM